MNKNRILAYLKKSALVLLAAICICAQSGYAADNPPCGHEHKNGCPNGTKCYSTSSYGVYGTGGSMSMLITRYDCLKPDEARGWTEAPEGSQGKSESLTINNAIEIVTDEKGHEGLLKRNCRVRNE